MVGGVSPRVRNDEGVPRGSMNEFRCVTVGGRVCGRGANRLIPYNHSLRLRLVFISITQKTQCLCGLPGGVILHLISDCTHFEACSAPICPLDSDWHLKTYIRGESICYYLKKYPLEALKGGCIAEQFGLEIGRVGVDILNRYTPSKRRVPSAGL